MALILDVTPISDVAQMPIKKGTLDFLQQAHKEEVFQTLKAAIGDSYNASTVYVLSGCVNSGSFPNYDISAGAVFYLGEVFRLNAVTFAVTGGNVAVCKIGTTQYTVDADPVTFTDASVHNVHNIREVNVSSTTSGTGIADFSALVYNAVRFPQATETVIGVAEIATQSETDAGLNDTNIVTPAKLEGSYGMVKSAWVNETPSIDGTTNIATTSNESFSWKVIGKTVHCRYFYNITTSGSGSTDIIWDMSTLTTPLTGLAPQCSNALQGINGSSYNRNGACRIGNGSDYTKMVHVVNSVAGAETIQVTGTITFEIA